MNKKDAESLPFTPNAFLIVETMETKEFYVEKVMWYEQHIIRNEKFKNIDPKDKFDRTKNSVYFFKIQLINNKEVFSDVFIDVNPKTLKESYTSEECLLDLSLNKKGKEKEIIKENKTLFQRLFF